MTPREAVATAMIGGMPLAPRPRTLVGRTGELDRLRSAIGLTGEGGLAGVVVSGDAGVGKSRLVAEIGDEATRAGHLLAVGHCVGVGGSALAWLPFVEIVAGLDESVPEVVATTLATHPALSALHHGGEAVGTDDPGRVAQAVHALLTEAAREHPLLVVVVEDVHWADHSSRDLLTLLLTRGYSTPVTLVVTYRSDDVHRRHPLHDVLAVWTRLPLATRVDLGPLPASDMGRLVQDLGDRGDADLREVVERAGGNPFFAEELVASGDATSTDLARLLRLRLDRLDAPARTVVRAAALASGPLDPELLAAVVDMDPDDLDEALHQAIDHHLLESVGDRLRFRHSLLGETLAEELLPGARQRLHRAWIGALRARPGLGSPADLARHAAATGDTETAVTAAVAAGDEALRVGGARDAQRLYEAALGWLDDDAERRGRIALVASRAADRAGDSVRAIDLLEEAVRDLDPAEHPVLRARLLARAAAKYTTLDLPSDPVAMSSEAVALLPQEYDEECLTVALDHLDVLVNSRHVDAGAVADDLLLRAEHLGMSRVVSRVRMQQARLLAATDPDLAYQGLMTAAADESAPDVLLPTLLRLGNLDRNAGRLESAHAHYTRGVAVAEREKRTWGPYGMECRLQAGRAAYELGRWDEAERLLTSPDDLPQPPRGFMESALVESLVARGEDGLEHRLDGTRDWWDVDALLVVGCLGGMIDVLGRAGEANRLLEWVVTGVESLQRAWGPRTQAIVRITALLAGQSADLAADGRVPEDLLTALRQTTHRLAGQVGEIVPDLRIPPGPDGIGAVPAVAPVGEGSDPASAGGEREPVGPESRAWARRLEAELLRLDATASSDEVVDAWQRSVAAFADLPQVPEHARSLLRLAQALTAAGRADEARVATAASRALATRLGARPVLEALAVLDAPAARAAGADSPHTASVDSPRADSPRTTPLTPRESEVLALLERGRTNGQIAAELFISRKTASVHVSNILAKLGAATRGEAVSLARDAGLIG